MATKRIVFKFVLVLVSILVTLLAASAGWRLYSRVAHTRVHPKHYSALKAKLDYNARSLYQFDEHLSYRLKPLFEGERHGAATSLVHRTNERGLLGSRKVTLNDKTKLLFLGDSLTYGDGMAYEQIFTSHLQTQLGSAYEVFNAGCPGWSTHQELSFYDQYLSDVDWDTVFIVFCMNDLVRFEWVYKDDSTFVMSQEVRSFEEMLSATPESLGIKKLRSQFASKEATAPLCLQSNAVLVAWLDAPWVEFEASLSGFLQKHKRSSARFVVLVVPTWPQIVAISQQASPKIVLRPQYQLMRICANQGIEFWDGGEAFMGRAMDRDTFRDDLHMGRDGHRWLAEYLADRYRRKN